MLLVRKPQRTDLLFRTDLRAAGIEFLPIDAALEAVLSVRGPDDVESVIRRRSYRRLALVEGRESVDLKLGPQASARCVEPLPEHSRAFAILPLGNPDDHERAVVQSCNSDPFETGDRVTCPCAEGVCSRDFGNRADAGGVDHFFLSVDITTRRTNCCC